MLLLLVICGGMLSVCLAGCKDSIAYPFRRIYTDAGAGGTGDLDAGAGPDTAPPYSCPTALVGYATLDGGTTGGGDGPMYTADTLAQLRTYAGMAGPAIVRINGTIAFPTDAGTPAQPVEVVSDKTVIPVHVGDGLVYNGLRVKEVHNVIVRNVTIAKALNGFDGITIQKANNVWVDHCDISSDLTSPKATYDGLVDIVHGSHNITVSWNRFHDHYGHGVSLVGHTDTPNPATDGTEDLALAVTFHHNSYSHVVEGAPRARFGHVHLFNNFYDTVQMPSDPTAATYAIASTDGATLLIESNVFDQVTSPIVTILSEASVTTGTVNDPNNLYGTGSSPSGNNITTARNNWKPPYQYAAGTILDPADDVRANVGMCAGPGNVP
jgi:pectate lyase